MSGVKTKNQRLVTVEKKLRDHNINPLDLISRDEIVSIKYQYPKYENINLEKSILKYCFCVINIRILAVN